MALLQQWGRQNTDYPQTNLQPSCINIKERNKNNNLQT